jgi:RNA polymerase-binding protein DksA
MTDNLTSAQLAEFKRKLTDRSQALRAEVRDTLLRTDSERYADLAGLVHDAAEEALADVQVDVNLAEVTRDIEEIRDCEMALKRIAMGTYGNCVTCREPVASARLQAYPTAKRCLSCQQAYDRTRPTRRPPTL